MTRVVVTRGAWAALTLLGAVGFSFALVVWAPGDPIDLLPNAEAVRPTLEARWHLDQSPLQRMASWWRLLLAGDLGTSLSYRPGAPVWEVIRQPVVATGLRVLAALAVAITTGSVLALRTGGQRRSRTRLLVQLASLAPLFLLAHGAVALLNEGAFALMQAGCMGRPGWFALPDQASLLRSSLAIGLLAVGSSSLHEVHAEIEHAVAHLQESPFVDAARARGEATWPLLLRHLLPTACSVAASRVGWLLGGAVVVEKLLLLPGAGAVLWNAALLRDYEVVLGLTLVAAAAVVVARLLADLARVWLDPRLRASA